MTDSTRDALRSLIEDYGAAILEDPDRLSQFLEDRCPSKRADNFRVSFALRYLLKSGWTPQLKLSVAAITQYAEGLNANLGYSRDDAYAVLAILRDVTTPARAEEEPAQANSAVVAHPGNLRHISGGIANKPRTMWLRKKSLYNGLILIVALIAIAVLFFQIGNQRNPVGDEFRVAFFAQMSGPSGQLSHDQLRAAQLAVELINRQGGVRGYKLKIVGYDVPQNPAAAEAAVRRAMQDKSILVMMTGLGGSQMDMLADIADDIDVPLIITSPEVNNQALVRGDKPALYAFHIANDTNARAKALAYFATQGLKKKKFGLLYASDVASSSGAHEKLARWLRIFGGGVTADLSFAQKNGTPEDSVFQAISASGAELLIITGKQPQAALAVKAARAAGLKMQILAEGYNASYFDTIGAALAGSWWINEVTSLDPQIRSMLKEYRNLYNENCPPEDVENAVLAYDGVQWIADALYQAPGYRGEAIRHALLATKNFALTHATLSIDPRTHGPLNKAVAVVYCPNGNGGGIFQKRVVPGKSE